MILISMFLGPLVTSISLVLITSLFGVVSSEEFRAAFDISIFCPCDAIAVCEEVAVFGKKLASI